jgi:hypothetical protein
MFCVFSDLSTAGLSDSGPFQGVWMGNTHILLILVHLDASLSPDGLYRLLHEKREMVGVSHPIADDCTDRIFLSDLFFGFPVL